jgi:hypothetical protein
LTVLESVHCPTCSTHYGLKAPRVRIGIRRARCFRCSSIFSIESEVLRLTRSPEPQLEETSIGPEDLLDLQPLVEEAPVTPAEAVAETGPPDLYPLEATPSLTLGDLEGVEDEILEKTLVVEGERVHPETPAPELSPAPATALPEDEFDSTSGGYSSAKDAITKLLGSVPAQDMQQDRRGANRTPTQMDVEATLDALESTLGGVSSKDLGTKPIMPPPELTQSELEPVKPMASTMKLTHDEIMSAMKAASIPTPSPLARPVAAPKPPVPTVMRESMPETETSLLKLQVGQEIYNNISMEQITTWIEQGRVQDFHMVARQFSENWIEAGKVPTLRPVFDRIRRQQAPAAQQAQAVILPPPSETAPIKKSLFGGLFNRG